MEQAALASGKIWDGASRTYEARGGALKKERIDSAKEKIAYYDATLTETAKHLEELNAGKTGTMAAKAASKDPNCEWMFADVATGLLGVSAWARFNPLRWSGAQSFDVAVEKLEAVKKTQDQPIVVKVPAGLWSPEHRFADSQAAIDFIKNHDPKHLTLQAEEVEAARQNAIKTMDDANEKLQEFRDE